MIECRSIAERLTSYVDRALTTEQQVEVEQHLEQCPRCRSAVVEEQGGRTVVRQRAERLRSEPIPPGLRSRCAALARAHTGGSTGTQHGAKEWRMRLVPVSLTAILFVFTASALFSLATHRSDALLAAQLTADHSKCFRLFAPPDASGVNARDVEQMLADQHGWDLHVPPSSAAEGVQLIGARRCLYADGRVPHVMYRVNGQDVSLYMLEGVTRPPADLVSLGHRTRIWSRGATTYVLVSRASAGEMASATRYVMQVAP
jgi:anti-sigma factor RsiW